MNDKDDIKVGDIVYCKLIISVLPCTVVGVKNGWFLRRYLVSYPWADIGTHFYKKYRWQLFKINKD